MAVMSFSTRSSMPTRPLSRSMATGPPPAGGSHCTHSFDTRGTSLSTTAPTLPGWPPTEPRDIASRLLAASGRATSRPRSRPHQSIAVIGSSVSAADDPEGTAAWRRQQVS